MDLQELFDMLATGELQNLSLAEGGKIATEARPKLTRYTNEALLELYSKFVLKENDMLIQLHEHITFYHLIPRFAVNYTPEGEVDDEPIRYILDLPKEKFEDELIRVLAVTDTNGLEVPLNNEEERFSVFTPQAKILQVPNPVQDKCLNVRYQQRHTKLQGELEERVECPDVLLVALTSYIAFKVFSHMNSAESTAKAGEFMQAYEAACNGVVDRDLVNSSTSQTNTRFERGGWV